jgi:hypothetical protein
MLFQVVLNIIVFFIKCIVWILAGLVAIPFGAFMLLNNWFPIFTHDGGFWFWSVFGILTIVAYIVLWKPLLWVVGIFQLLGGMGE